MYRKRFAIIRLDSNDHILVSGHKPQNMMLEIVFAKVHIIR